ncbi:cytochrome C [Pseudohongiella sp. O18]|uniref:cytochrome C n=1 Tax=Pseudohongiella sp. O18 TaxID=2904248 RepID=UPI001F1D2AEE|nr:cytochrome C [Pseudohongiella sp. O18]
MLMRIHCLDRSPQPGYQSRLRFSHKSRIRAAAVTLLLSLLPMGKALAQHGQGPQYMYLLHCGGCHIENGSGMPPAIPDLRITMPKLASHDEGRAYMVQVPGASQAPVTDAQLTEIMNWMLRTFAEGTFRPYTESEVTQHRANKVLDILALRRQLIAENLEAP